MSLVTIRTYVDQTSAEIARGLLEPNGIDAFIMADNEGGLNPGLSFSTGIRLMTHEKHMERAKELLDQDADSQD